MFSFAIFVPFVLLATTKNQITKFWIVFHKMCKCYDVIDGELMRYFCELNRNEVSPFLPPPPPPRGIGNYSKKEVRCFSLDSLDII